MDTGTWHVLGRVLAAGAGTASLLIGMVLLGAELAAGGGRERSFLLFAGVCAAGGAALLLVLRLHLRPGRLGWAAVAAATLVGTGVGLLNGTERVCCMFVYAVSRGYPFTWLHRSAAAEHPATAKAAALRDPWSVQVEAALANTVFWVQLGLVVVAAVLLFRRAVRDRVGVRP